jgi:hypothetical protein
VSGLPSCIDLTKKICVKNSQKEYQMCKKKKKIHVTQEMSSSFHFPFFGHFDQEVKKSAVIFRQNANFFIQTINKQDSCFIIFGSFDVWGTRDGMNGTIEKKYFNPYFNNCV